MRTISRTRPWLLCSTTRASRDRVPLTNTRRAPPQSPPLRHSLSPVFRPDVCPHLPFVFTTPSTMTPLAGTDNDRDLVALSRRLSRPNLDMSNPAFHLDIYSTFRFPLNTPLLKRLSLFQRQQSRLQNAIRTRPPHPLSPSSSTPSTTFSSPPSSSSRSLSSSASSSISRL